MAPAVSVPDLATATAHSSPPSQYATPAAALTPRAQQQQGDTTTNISITTKSFSYQQHRDFLMEQLQQCLLELRQHPDIKKWEALSDEQKQRFHGSIVEWEDDHLKKLENERDWYKNEPKECQQSLLLERLADAEMKKLGAGEIEMDFFIHFVSL
ncbi:hypothetical protein HDU76_000446 [Blyttiomyces sp. JEL0837]|nr:hypothetical protein HDU76_000446 [Blyttiomyces sp. JEL0837]